MSGPAEANMGAGPTDRPADEPRDEGRGMPQLRHQHLVEFAPDGHLLTDRRGIVLEANQAAAALLCCSKEFLIGKPLGLLMAEGHRSRFYRSLASLHGEIRSDAFESMLGRPERPRIVSVRVSELHEDVGADGVLQWLLQDITERRQAEIAREDLMRQLVRAQEDERRRIARELHDSLGQLITALLLEVRAARDAGPMTEQAAARLDNVRGLAEEVNRAAHDLAVRLRPTALDDMGLHAAARAYVQEWSARTEVAVQFQAVGVEGRRFPPDIETALYRVLQEALTNVAKYAGASRVAVVLEHQEGRAILAVEDDGAGFEPDAVAAKGRLGLLGMRERMTLLGGTMDLETSPGAGTTVIARVPTRPLSPPERA